MPMTLSDEQIAYLRNRENVANFADALYNDPTISTELKRLIKRKHPDLPIPDYDAEQRLNARFDAEKKEREDAETKARNDKELADWQAERDRVREKHKFTEDAMERMEKMMLERRIGNYEDAAELMIAREPKTSSPTQELDDRLWHHNRNEQFKEIAKDPQGWARNELMAAMARDKARAETQR